MISAIPCLRTTSRLSIKKPAWAHPAGFFGSSFRSEVADVVAEHLVGGGVLERLLLGFVQVFR